MITFTMSRAQDKEKSERPTGIEPTTFCTPRNSWRAGPYTQGSCLICINVQWNLDVTKGQGTGKNMFAITRFRYIEVLFHIFLFYCYWGKENCSLYGGLRYIEVRYIEVPLYLSGLSPSDSFDEALADMIHDGVNDLRNDLAKGHFEKDETKKVQFFSLNSILGAGVGYFL